jgi:paraquat-inducible protein A
MLALGLAAALLFALANAFPMLGLSAVGHSAETTVLGGARQLWRDGREIVAGLVLFTVVIAPALQIGFVLAIALAGSRRGPTPRWVGALLRRHPLTRTWSMIEVMLLGVLVALIKIAELATVIPGIALYALGALAFVLAAVQASFDPRRLWRRVTWACPEARP